MRLLFILSILSILLTSCATAQSVKQDTDDSFSAIADMEHKAKKGLK